MISCSMHIFIEYWIELNNRIHIYEHIGKELPGSVMLITRFHRVTYDSLYIWGEHFFLLVFSNHIVSTLKNFLFCFLGITCIAMLSARSNLLPIVKGFMISLQKTWYRELKKLKPFRHYDACNNMKTFLEDFH